MDRSRLIHAAVAFNEPCIPWVDRRRVDRRRVVDIDELMLLSSGCVMSPPPFSRSLYKVLREQRPSNV